MDVRLDAAAAGRRRSPDGRRMRAAFDDLDAMLEAGGLDAVDRPRTGAAACDGQPGDPRRGPAPLLGEADRRYASRRPIGSSRRQPTAASRSCAHPASRRRGESGGSRSSSTPGDTGVPTLVVAHHADPGPAAWREYTGDPRPFYGPGVGPVIDHGVYRLHAHDDRCSDPSRVSRRWAPSATPTRIVRGGPLTGQDDRGHDPGPRPDQPGVRERRPRPAAGQLRHGQHPGSLARGAPHEGDGQLRRPVARPARAGQPLRRRRLARRAGGLARRHRGPDGRRRQWSRPGVRHFVDCLRGEAEPVLTAEHARHVLDVIVKAYASIEDGASHRTDTTF